MPYYPPQAALRRGIDLAFGKKQITASVTSALLQGKSIDGISTALMESQPTCKSAFPQWVHPVQSEPQGQP